MSQFARLHQEFEDVTGLSKRLNQALLILKRAIGHIEPIPDARRQEDAKKDISDILRFLLEKTESGPRRSWTGSILDEISKVRRRSNEETRGELQTCLIRTGESPNQVGADDLQLLDQIGTALDQSSAALYRELIHP